MQPSVDLLLHMPTSISCYRLEKKRIFIVIIGSNEVELCTSTGILTD